MTDYAPLTLHVPEPAVRPGGGTPDFSSVGVPRAGSVERPDVNADPGFDPRPRLFDHPRS